MQPGAYWHIWFFEFFFNFYLSPENLHAVRPFPLVSCAPCCFQTRESETNEQKHEKRK